MGKNTNFVSHKKSKLKENGGPKLPLAADLVEGEIAINFGKDVETLSIKNESGDVVTFSSDNYYTEKKLGSGFTGENSANTVTSVIESNEKVTALALADLDERKLEKSDLSNYYKKKEIDDLVGSGFSSSSITEVITENEEIVSSALVDLDERKLDASAYTPSVELWVSGTGVSSVVLKGSSGTASGNYSVAEGYSTSATSQSSHAEGSSTVASGDYSHAEGLGTKANGGSSHAEGNYTTASGFASHAEGYSTMASGGYSHAEGQGTTASGGYSHVEGSYTTASGDYSHAEGNNTKASGSSSHAEGSDTKATGNYSHAEGSYAIASGNCSHAEGNGTKANGGSSHAEGNYTTASGFASHAEGYSTTASGGYSHAEGQGTTASGGYSHVEGSYTTASGDYSHAEGNNTKASGDYSHAEGSHTVANNQSEHASGQYNISNSASTTFGDSGNTLFSVGNGTAYDARHNAFEIRQNGDIYITSGGTTTSPMIKLQDSIETDLSNYYTKSETSGATEISNAFAQKLNISDFNSYSGTVDTAISLKASQSDLTALSGTVTGHTSNTNIHLTTTEKTNLDSLVTNIGTISGITSAKVSGWDTAATNSHSHTNKTALDSITGNVGTMAYQATTSYSSATQVNTALDTKVNTVTFTAHTADTDVHFTTNDRLKWETLNRRTRKNFTASGMTYFINTLKSAIEDQDLEKYGMKVGDYYTVTHGTNTYNYVIAGLNTMRGTSTPYRLNYDHVGIIVDTDITHKWNESGNTYQSTNTYSTGGTWTTGASAAGYANCDLHYYLTTTVLGNVKTDLGSGNIKSHYKLYSNAVNTSGYNRFGSAGGCSSSWTWYANQEICALSEVQVYGSIVWSSSGYDTGEACRQLDVFRVYNMNEIFGNEYPWLRDVASSSDACRVGNNGNADNATASPANYVAALILFA